MPEAVATPTQTPPPEAQIAEILLSQYVPRLVHLTASLKLADHLAEGPRTAVELATLTGTYGPALSRILRTLASMGFFTEDAEHRFSLTPLGAVLKSGTPSHAAALILGGEAVTRSLDHLLSCAQTGKTGFERAFDMPIFDWLGANPTQASLFNETMMGFHGMEPLAVAAVYDFSVFKTVADVGGSTGSIDCDDPVALSGGARHPVRSAARGPERTGVSPAARRGRSRPHRSGQLLRQGSRWRRRLPAFACHPRLES